MFLLVCAYVSGMLGCAPKESGANKVLNDTQIVADMKEIVTIIGEVETQKKKAEEAAKQEVVQPVEKPAEKPVAATPKPSSKPSNKPSTSTTNKVSSKYPYYIKVNRLANCVTIYEQNENCAKGTTVEIYDSSNPGPSGKPSAMKIDVNSPYAKWDPTDPDAANPWKTAKPTISGVVNVTTQQGTEVDYSSYVSAKDVYGNVLEVVVTGSVDWNISGVYQIAYSATDRNGNTTTVFANVTIDEVDQGEDAEETERRS